MDKSHRVDTLKGAVETFKGARDVPIPAHMEMDATARMQWDLVTRTKSADAWTLTDLELVHELCCLRSQKSRIRSTLPDVESDFDMEPHKRLRLIVDAEKMLDTLVKRDIALTRILQIHPAATQGEARDQVAKNKANAKARDTKEGTCDLIAMPQR